MIEPNWKKEASNLLKTELTRRDLSYDDLRLALEKLGIKKTNINIRKTINDGKFPFFFFLQCAKAIGIDRIQLTKSNFR